MIKIGEYIEMAVEWLTEHHYNLRLIANHPVFQFEA